VATLSISLLLVAAVEAGALLMLVEQVQVVVVQAAIARH
jgi:hypothetical protein